MSRTAVIVVHYNNLEDTRRCVASLSANGKRPDLIVINNESRQPGIAGAIGSYPNVTIIRSKKNLGFGRANNLGLREALKNPNYEFFFFLNNDATAEPGTVSSLEMAMSAYPEAGIVSPRIVLMENPDALWYGGGEVDWYRGKGRVPGYLGPANSKLALTSRDVNFVSGCAMFVRRAVFEQVGGFDPRFFMYIEDLEFCLRVKEAGWRLRYVSGARIRHRGQGSQRKESQGFLSPKHPRNPNLSFVLYHMTKNQLLGMGIHAKGANRLRFRVGFPAFLLLDCVRYIMAGRWRVMGDVAKGLSGYCHARRLPFRDELQGKRRSYEGEPGDPI